MTTLPDRRPNHVKDHVANHNTGHVNNTDHYADHHVHPNNPPENERTTLTRPPPSVFAFLIAALIASRQSVLPFARAPYAST